MKSISTKRRIWIGIALVAVLLALALLPPLINVNRFSRRIAGSISSSLGRPVTLDNVRMKLLPLPGFTIENFVVSEDPRFGDEPVMRADVVYATLRWSSLWRGRLEVSTISLQEPHVNLVQNAEGKWNLEAILMHAAAIDSAPTQQAKAGPTPRFPYIEATDGRINVKLGEEKTPLSLTGAEFALWLPNPQEWRFRIKARPVRTDTDASDTGEVNIEATLRRAASVNDVPVQMESRWKDIQLGEGSKVLFGKDMGWRGVGAITLRIDGTLGDASVTSDVRLRDVRRADFVPARQMDVESHCEARATGVLHSLLGLRCSMQADPANGAHVATSPQIQMVPAGTLSLTGDVPSVTDWNSADLSVKVSAISPEYALDWLRLFSIRIPPRLQATGSLDGAFSHGPATAGMWAGNATCNCTLSVPEKDDKVRQIPVQMDAEVTNDGTGGRAVDVSVVVSPVDKGHPAAANSHAGLGAMRINGEGFEAHSAGGPTGVLTQMGSLFPPLVDGMPTECATQECSVLRHWGDGQPVWTVRAATTRKGQRRK